MTIELHIDGKVIQGGSLEELKVIAEDLGLEYKIYQVYKSKMWEIPVDKSMRIDRSFEKMTTEQMKEAAAMYRKEGKYLKEIAPIYNVTTSYISKAIRHIEFPDVI